VEIVTCLDGRKIREDYHIGREVTTHCYGERLFFWYSNQGRPGGSHNAMSVRDLAGVDRKQWYVHEPLKLMLIPLWYRAGEHYHMESFVAPSKQADVRIEKVDWKGDPARKVTFKQGSSEAELEYVVVPSKGHNVVRMEQRSKSGDRLYVDVVEANLKQVGRDIWFPDSVKYVRTVNGTRKDQEDLTIEVSQLNEPIDAALFSPVSMNIPVNTRVSRIPPDPRGELKWDGNNFVVMSNAEALGVPARPSSTKRLYLSLLALSITFAAAGGYIYWSRYLRPSRSEDGGSEPAAAA
jgi:hypothetical protein